MRCHYEVLNVSRYATFNEIKKAYKKLVIKWHPDKNLDNTEKATEEFQLIKRSFEVLSDPHVREWYDNHMDAILRGKVSSQYECDNFDVYQYFALCYKRFGDDECGFYSIYRKLFNKIAAEDSKYQTEEENNDFNIPDFGKSNSSFEDVECFYSYWQSYCTKNPYDPYDVTIAPNRKLARIEKENKKIRDKARKT
ncbi:dnaJ homolog subfamily C member 21-like [Lycorma delicatula]|uniref:dnaJ homolog subfamily C member 21-like n=1 Tax=Lycorma delicatula TaxID=130591 RepID=UPI003F512EB0